MLSYLHPEEFGKLTKKSMCYFIAPSIFRDSVRQIEFVKKEDNLFISPKTIEEFLGHLENNEVLCGTI